MAWRASLPFTWRSEGIFHTFTENPKNALSKTLQTLGGIEGAPLFHDDLKTLLDSSPVLEKVVRSHCCQMVIQEKESFFKRVWNNVRLEKAHLLAKRFGKGEALPCAPFAERSHVICTQVTHEKRHYLPLTATFLDEERFQIGTSVGKIGSPFSWKGSSFTLEKQGSDPLEGRVFLLTLLPKDAACHRLKGALKIFAEKKKISLVHLSCKGNEREWVYKVVCDLMQAYQDYLWEEGKKRVDLSLHYLDKREQEIGQKFEKIAAESNALSSSQMEERGFFTVEQEMQALIARQNHLQERWGELEEEKKRLWDANPLEPPTSLTLDGVRKRLLELEELLSDNLQTEHHLLLALEKLPDSPLLEIAPLLTQEAFAIYFTRIRELEGHLIDSANWSPKEQLWMLEELQTLRSVLQQECKSALSSQKILHTAFCEEQALLKRHLLFLIEKEREVMETQMADLTENATNLALRYAREERLNFEKQMQKELWMTLAETMEEKSSTLYMQSLKSKGIDFPLPPPLPVKAHLLLSLILGAVGGSCLYALLLLLIEIRKGPTASKSNLEALGKTVISTFAELRIALADKESVLFLTNLQPPLNEQKIIYHRLSKEARHLHSSCIVVQPTIERMEELSFLPPSALFYIPSTRPSHTLSSLLQNLLNRLKKESHISI